MHVVATAEGDSRFEERDLDATLRPGDHLYVLRRQPATEARIILAGADWTPFQPTASRRYIVVMQGRYMIETSDQASRSFDAGDVVVLEGLTGKGHRTCGHGMAMVVLLDTTRFSAP